MSNRMSIFLCIVLAWVGLAWAGNDHGKSGSDAEQRAWWYESLSGFVTSGCAPLVPSSSLTISSLGCNGRVQEGDEQWYVTQAPTAVTVPDSPTVWLAIDRDSRRGVTDWTRQGLTHFIFQAAATIPTAPNGTFIVAKITVVSNVISAIEDIAPRIITNRSQTFSSHTVGAGAVWTFAPGAQVELTGTLPFGGCIQAFREQIFTGSGVIQFVPGCVTEIKPAWWGASPAAAAATNTAAMKAAITAQNLTGIPVVLGSGVFTVASDGANAWAVELKENLTLHGQGPRGTILKLDDNAGSFARVLSTDSSDSNGVPNVHVAHLGIDGNQVNQTICSEQCHCIFYSGVVNGSVRDTELFNCKGDGFYAHVGMLGASTSTARVNVTDNDIHDLTRVGINVNDCSGCTIHANRIYNIVDNWGIKSEADAGATNVVAGTVIDSNVLINVGAGISVSTATATTNPKDDWIISNNHIDSDEGVGGVCINVRGPDRMVIEGNTCRDFPADGIMSDSASDFLVIQGNSIRASNPGIAIGGGALVCNTDIIISDNIIRAGGGAGVRLSSCSGADVPTNIQIRGNTVLGFTGVAGLDLNDGTRVLVAENMVTSNGVGIDIGAGAVGITDLVIANNITALHTIAGVRFQVPNDGHVLCGNNFNGEGVLAISGIPGGGTDTKWCPNASGPGFQTGRQTLDGATPTTVTFPIAEVDTQYEVVISCAGNEGSIWQSNLTTTGFDINTSGAHSANCRWILARDN